MKKFKKYEGKYIEDLPKQILNVLDKQKDARVHIGTDSQRHGNYIHFATVIAFRYGSRGVHYIYQFKKMALFRTIQTRLTHEIELTVNLVMWLKEYMPHRHQTATFDEYVAGDNFIRGTISKVHYDLL